MTLYPRAKIELNSLTNSLRNIRGIQKRQLERHTKTAHNRKPKLMDSYKNHNQTTPTHQGPAQDLITI